MNKRLIIGLIILGIILLIGISVTAYTIGQRFTEQQFMNIDFKSLNMDCEKSYVVVNQSDYNIVTVGARCLEMEIVEITEIIKEEEVVTGTEYVVVKKDVEFYYTRDNYKDCRIGFSISECSDNTYIKNHIIRKSLEYWNSRISYYSDIQRELESIKITFTGDDLDFSNIDSSQNSRSFE